MKPSGSAIQPKWLRRGIVLFLLALLGLGIGGLVAYFDKLDSYRLAGPAIIALVFFALAILGTWSEMVTTESVPDIMRGFAKFWIVMAVLVISFCGGAWLLIVLMAAIWPDWLPKGGQAVVYLIAFTWLVAGLIKFYSWLADRIDRWATRESKEG